MASFAIRGACVMTSGTLAVKLAAAWCTFGWLLFAAHHAVMIGSACAA